ncbi:MAG: hypothetical protein IJW24_01645 [Clostridia bacterium]|nr:hypothetical protein [Clostridia bacterium]
MINYDYIGDEQLELSVCFDKVGLIPLSEITNEKIFLNCPISCVHVKSSKGYAEILTKNNGRMRAEHDEVFTLIPVKHGYLAGSYVLVESTSVRGSEISKLYVLSQSKILHLVDVPRSVSKLDIDGFVSNAYLVQKTAHELNKFDASKGT